MALGDAQDNFRANNEWKVPAAEFIRSFSKWREVSHQHPVEITNHGRVSHVLTAIDYFERLIQSDRPMHDVTESSLFGLADWVDESIIVCSAAEELVYANRVAKAACHIDATPTANLPLKQVLPTIAGSLLEVHFRRTLIGREPTAADLPSPFMHDGWLHFRSFPLQDKTVLMFRDITEDVQRHRLGDVKEALLQAFSAHGSLGYLRLSMRGTIERVDAAMCQWLGLSEERLLGVPLVDLIARHSRVDCREAFEAVYDGSGPKVIDCIFMSNTDGELPLRCSIVQLHGAYGAEGLVVVLTRIE